VKCKKIARYRSEITNNINIYRI